MPTTWRPAGTVDGACEHCGPTRVPCQPDPCRRASMRRRDCRAHHAALDRPVAHDRFARRPQARTSPRARGSPPPRSRRSGGVRLAARATRPRSTARSPSARTLRARPCRSRLRPDTPARSAAPLLARAATPSTPRTDSTTSGGIWLRAPSPSKVVASTTASASPTATLGAATRGGRVPSDPSAVDQEAAADDEPEHRDDADDDRAQLLPHALVRRIDLACSVASPPGCVM